MKRGFALIVVLSLMILLTVVAVGLLSLASINIRSTTSQQARTTAMANARLSMQLALGELQRHAGPDTRITAPASVLSENSAQPHLTGVWDSIPFNPYAPTASNKTEKVKKFRTWLTSGSDFAQLANADYATTTKPADSQMILSRQVVADAAGEVSASRVEIRNSTSGKSTGSLAYAVFDEGVKAGLNLGQAKPLADLASRSRALGGGQRPGIDRIAGTGTLAADKFSLDTDEGKRRISKLVSLHNADLGYSVVAGNLSRRFHDVTTNSLGLMSDVSAGGFKRDLSLIAEATALPSELAVNKIYKTAYNLDLLSDPTWSQLIASMNFYRGKDAGGSYLSSSNGVPVLRATAPKDWDAGSGVISGPATPNPKAPSGPVLLPSIAKVQMVFSLAARDIYRYPKGQVIPPDPVYLHHPWAGFFRHPKPPAADVDSQYDYLLHMIYTPIITLHNPYNVAMEFKELRVEFVDLPFSLQVFRNGVSQTKGLVPFSGMYGGGGAFGQSKRFGLNITGKSAAGVPDNTMVRMAPGEVKVFSPYIPADRTWADEISQPLWFVDWANNNSLDGRTWTNLEVDTSKIKAASGWRGDGIGYDLDSFAPGKYNVSGVEVENGREYQRDQCLGLRAQDDLHVEFAPIPDPDRATTKFTVEMTLIGANPNTKARTSVISFQYGTLNGLQDILLGKNVTLRYPEVGEINTMDIFDHSSVPVGSTSNTRPFALFSAFAKTTHGGYNGTRDDGSYASKPWAFHNHSALTASQNTVKEHPAQHSHEINLVRLPGNTDEIMDIQPGTDRGHFITGHRVLTGRRLAPIHDIPLGPPQSLTALNSALPAASYYLPRVTSPVGNSFAHPLLPPESVTKSGPGGYLYADHSMLLNSVLYDGYYLSGLQGRDGAFGDGKTARDLATGFFAGTGMLQDTRFQPHLPNKTTAAKATDALMAVDGYRRAGAYQLLRGAFNVNSTSIDAWKAELSSMSGEGGSALSVSQVDAGQSIEPLAVTGEPKGARFSRFRLPNAQPGTVDAENYWQSPRDLSEVELTKLATEIVKQVRLRGPFLSMSDFVNRQPGPAGETSLKGALQAGIDKAGINSNSGIAGFDISANEVSSQKLSNPDAATGPSAQGAPGYLTQADLLSVMGNAVTVRSDTFVIRSYGDARDSSGNVTATAWCEAVVQRMPEYVDSADLAEVRPVDLKSAMNRTFGRRFEIISFRWLSPNEV